MIRFIQGIVVGAVLMLGSAYLHDTGIFASNKSETPPAFVNWDTLLGSIGR